MAYVRTKEPACPIGGDPVVACLDYVLNTTGETNIPIYVDKPHQKLAHVRATVLVVIDSTAACEVDIEKGAAGGTEVATISVPKDSTAGTVVDGTLIESRAAQIARENLGYGDYFTAEVDGSGAATGAIKLDFIFEPM